MNEKERLGDVKRKGDFGGDDEVDDGRERGY